MENTNVEDTQQDEQPRQERKKLDPETNQL